MRPRRLLLAFSSGVLLAGTAATPAAAAGHFTEYPIPTTSAHPFTITMGPDGNLWFTEAGGNKIGRITADGVITE